MLSLNIKSSSYMCLDIATGNYTSFDDGLLEYYLKKKIMEVSDDSYHEHNLIMLPSFHISLGRPPQTEEELKVYEEYKSHTIDPKKVVPIIGDITLAPINISKKDGKKSAWIPLDAEWFVKLFWLSQDPTFCPEYELNLTHFKPYPYDENYKPSRTLHISLANLTGNPHDSIARPEDCIINTITA